MIADKAFPGKWKKYGEAWEAAVTYWRLIAENLMKVFVAFLALILIFVKLGISWPTIIAGMVILYFAMGWAVKAKRAWFIYSVVECDTSIIIKPKWSKMGGTEDEWVKRKIFDTKQW